MIILGMTGPIGHGKTTLANVLAAQLPRVKTYETYQLVAEVADAWHSSLTTIPQSNDIDEINKSLLSLPAIIQDILHQTTTSEQLELTTEVLSNNPAEYQKLFLHLNNLRQRPDLIHHKITDINKESYRPILQWLGGYLVQKVDNGIWYKELVRRIRKARTQGYDLCLISGVRYPMDAAILREARGIVIKVYRPDFGQVDANDPTERERDSIEVASTIVNNGTISDLEKLCLTLVKDLKHNQLKPLYSAKDT